MFNYFYSDRGAYFRQIVGLVDLKLLKQILQFFTEEQNSVLKIISLLTFYVQLKMLCILLCNTLSYTALSVLHNSLMIGIFVLLSNQMVT